MADWETEVEVTERGQEEKQRVTDPSPIGGRGSTRGNKAGKGEQIASGGTQAVQGDPRESPKTSGGRKSTGGKVADAPEDPGPKLRRRGKCQEAKGFQRMERGNRRGGLVPGERRG